MHITPDLSPGVYKKTVPIFNLTSNILSKVFTILLRTLLWVALNSYGCLNPSTGFLKGM